jgi:hypothetical protein
LFYAVKEEIAASELFKVLADDACVKVRLWNCEVKERVDISKARLDRNKDGQYIIDKEISFFDCTFYQDVYFSPAQFQ